MGLKKGLIEELKIKTETYYAIQKNRIQAQLRIKAYVRDDRLEANDSKGLHFWLDDVVKRMEDEIKKDITLIVKDVPIWKEFLKEVKGIGPCLAGSLVAGIQDISRFDRVSSLWKYCGQDVVLSCTECGTRIGQAESCPDCGGTELTGEAPRREKKKKISWNPFLRMTIFKMTDSFIKQNADTCQYRRLYNEKKKFYQEKFPEYARCWKCNKLLIPQVKGPDKCSTPECKGQTGGIPHPTRKIVKGPKKGDPIYIHTRGHLNMMAKRYAGKIFLEHLWVAWREIEGLPVSKPWIMNDPKHTHYIASEVS